MSNFTAKSSDLCYLPHGHLDGPSPFQFLHWYAQTPKARLLWLAPSCWDLRYPSDPKPNHQLYIYIHIKDLRYTLCQKPAQSPWRNPPSCHLHQHSQSKSAPEMRSEERYRQGSSAPFSERVVPKNSKTIKSTLSHRIHGTGIFTYMNGWFFMVNVGNYTIHGLFGSGKLTWQWTIPVSNREYIFRRSIFYSHVSLPKGTYFVGGETQASKIESEWRIQVKNISIISTVKLKVHHWQKAGPFGDSKIAMWCIHPGN